MCWIQKVKVEPVCQPVNWVMLPNITGILSKLPRLNLNNLFLNECFYCPNSSASLCWYQSECQRWCCCGDDLSQRYRAFLWKQALIHYVCGHPKKASTRQDDRNKHFKRHLVIIFHHKDFFCKLPSGELMIIYQIRWRLPAKMLNNSVVRQSRSERKGNKRVCGLRTS